MKKLFTLLLLVLVAFSMQAQRYRDKVFTTVTMDSVLYGNAINWDNSAQELKMNIFQPAGDTASKRPLLVLAHGGSFINGSRYNEDVAYLCREFAKRGYVCVSIQYRLGIDLAKFFNEGGTQFANAVWRGTLDGRAAVRFLRAHADSLKISTEHIYLGGVSAGGVLGLHQAFLDTESEVNASDPLIDMTAIGGGIEGLSGTPGQSWRVKGIINLCGGVGNVNWMLNNKDIAIFNVHGTNDQTVPYKTAYFKAFGFDVAKLSGGFVIDSMAKTLGMKSYLYTFVNAPHVPFSPGIGTTQSSTAYMDTTEGLLRDFLTEDLGRKVGLPDVLSNADVRLYPNPAKEQLVVQVDKGTKTVIELMNLTSQCLQRVVTEKAINRLNTEDLTTGIYIVTISNEYGKATRKVLIE
ncbi:MAG: T9SS type A sorting domain-containing protein [Bacteroidota bacterium]